MRLIRPIKDHILVKQDPSKSKSAGGLHLPQGKEIFEDTGTVIRLGTSKDLTVKLGDRILFKRRPGSHLGEANPEWQDLLMLKEEDIIAILEDEEPRQETAEPNTGFGSDFTSTGDTT